MSERLTLQDLTDLLAEQKGLTKKDAEAFLRELVALISETIEQNDLVRIKNFGTFKLTQVSARKSVDVNTGEEIEIASHYRLNFSPDKALREEINKPFAHFESIVLEEGVNFSEMQTSSYDEQDSEPDEDFAEDIATIRVENTALPIQQTEQEHETTILEEKKQTPDLDPNRYSTERMKENITNVLNREDNQLADMQHNEENEPSSPKSIEERIEQILDKTEDAESAIPTNTEEETLDNNGITQDIPAIQNEINHTVKPNLEKMEERNNYENNSYDDDDDLLEYEYPSNKKTYMYLAVLVVAILAIFLAVRYKNNADAASAAKAIELAQAAAEAEAAAAALLEPEPVVEEPKDMTDLDIATIKRNQTLRKLSEKYYGDRVFWVYIFEVNKDKVKNPNRLTVGSKFVIPSLNRFDVDPTSASDRAKAQQKENEYVRKYNFKLR